MNILHVVPSYFPAVRYGGPIVAVHGLCRALAARGHRVDVFTTNVDGAGLSDVPVGVPVMLEGVNVTYFASERLRRIYRSRGLGRALSRGLPIFDIVHLHSVFLWPTWAAARSARRHHVPYLLSPRGMLIKDLIARRSRIAKTAWIHLIERRNIECAAAVHVTSALEAAELRRFGWNLPPIKRIANGADEDLIGDIAISPDVADIVADRPFALFLGRLNWKKGIDRLLRAFACTTVGKLAIVGPDDEGQLPQLSALADSLHIGERVRFLPRTVVGSDKQQLYSAAQVFVLASYSENFGNTVVEAMQRGTPVIVTPEVGAAEILRAADAGLVSAGDPMQFGAALAQLMGDAALARALGDAGRTYVAAQLTWPRIAAEMESVYVEIKSQAPQHASRASHTVLADHGADI